MVDIEEMPAIVLGRLQRVFRRLINYEAAVLSAAIMAIRPQQTETVTQALSARASAVVAHRQIPVTPYFPLWMARLSALERMRQRFNWEAKRLTFTCPAALFGLHIF